jgi:hypothetical protein
MDSYMKIYMHFGACPENKYLSDKKIPSKRCTKKYSFYAASQVT